MITNNSSKNQINNSQEFNNRCYGIIIIRSKNSNFNADFSGFPRRLPDTNGTIYSTDKALKYAIRRYWVDKGQKVFVWKEFDDDLKPKSIKEKLGTNDKKNKREEILKQLLDYLDVRCFGVTYAGDENISICGPVQITYGINRFKDNIVYTNQILSPFNPQQKEQSTIGSEVKTLESHYVFDFVINPKNLYDHYQEIIKKEKNNHIKELFKLTSNDINLLKEAFCKSVTNLNSTSKIGSENELTLFITLVNESSLQLPTLKDLVNIIKDNDIYLIDLTKIFNYLEKYLNKDIEKIEIFYDEKLVNVKGIYQSGDNNNKIIQKNLNDV